MTKVMPGGYMGQILRVDLSNERVDQETVEEATLRKYLGGTGLGIHYLYQEVPPGVAWNDPANRMIFASGPLGGTRLGGSGNFSLVTKGCLTNGATSTQASGFLGAFLKFSGFDGIVMQGAARGPVYLYVHDGTAELRDAAHLVGKDTWETEDLVKGELGKSERECSVFSIGPAGENLVKFACIAGDKGHVAAHNGVGAVMGAKKLKAIAVSRGKRAVPLADKERISFLAGDIFEKIAGTPQGRGYAIARWGTQGNNAACQSRLLLAHVPVKNYTTNLFPGFENTGWESFGPLFEIKRNSCWACRFNHCHLLTVKEGPYAGYVGEEPEAEQFTSWGPVIGLNDLLETFMLSNEGDRLGLDVNESGWLIAWLMECFEKGVLTRDDLDGVEMRWGDPEAARVMLRKIARRDGVGDILAEGVLRASGHFGAKAQDLAIYTGKGNTPRSHDHRNIWQMMLDTCVSDTGTDAGSLMGARLENVGLPADADRFSPAVIAKLAAGELYRGLVDDCLGMCRFNNRGVGADYVADLLKAATGWNFTTEEVKTTGYRVVNLLRVFNLRHGHTAALDAPSARYSSTPDRGLYQGKTIAPVWRDAVQQYYGFMGWDKDTSRPLPETLTSLGLEHTIKDIW